MKTNLFVIILLASLAYFKYHISSLASMMRWDDEDIDIF